MISCCACPDTKKVRDDCFLRFGLPEESSESTIKCADLVLAHKACMAQYGYQI
ncbi:cytochrome c oxidase copper chaperone [Phakopsora pachyrhizi]|uniref:Cytochrome c oxidase copper chaperone n=1 Tax=Phakopsora pachyrhizi TaxID=170000 RepID=A0AAV0B7J1_PHAPC|nr:cytochrome c oxidase copper chaperone [Phakopsora pachyrhizi]CAH7681948.1 cytochrome c oxidase copper chaperone [Phakopsora pachyrhizi]